MLIRARTAAASISIISDEMLFSSTSCGAASGPVPKRRIDRRRSIERQRRNNGIDAGAVRQPGIDHRRGLINSAAHARHDAVDDLQQMAIVAKAGVRALKDPPRSMNILSLLFTRMSELFGSASSGSSGPRPNTSSSRSVLNSFLLAKTKRHALIDDDLIHHSRDCLPRLA